MGTTDQRPTERDGPVMRRGACPSLAAPMVTGDGLLVRLRPASGLFSPDAFRALLLASLQYGNGLLDITARGNLQIRGLRADSVPALAAALDQAGILPAEGTAIEVPALAGLDAEAITDPVPLVRRLADAIASQGLLLAPKLSIVLNSGGALHLGGQSADIRADAVRIEGKTVWRVALGGTAHRAVPVACVAEAGLVGLILDLLGRLSSLGPGARGRDLDAAVVASQYGGVPHFLYSVSPNAPVSPVGRHEIGSDIVLGLAPSFGQMRAADALALVDLAGSHGLTDIRPASGRALLLRGLDMTSVRIAEAAAGSLGFLADSSAPLLQLAACAGLGGCASAKMDTRSVGREMIAQAPGLFDGSIAVHVSGCAKGCARPAAAAALVLVAASSGIGLVVNGVASMEPIAYTGREKIGAAVKGLGRLVEETKRGGESAGSCLKRLDPARIAAVFQQD